MIGVESRRGCFTIFLQSWSIEIRNALNRGLMPRGYSALVEQRVQTKEPDVIAVRSRSLADDSTSCGTAVMAWPKTKTILTANTESGRYADRANRIAIHHPYGNVVAVIEIVSPGNKDSRGAIERFVEKTVGFLRNDIHVMVIDLFAPTIRDPLGLHDLIWSEWTDQFGTVDVGDDRSFVSYRARIESTAYHVTRSLGEALPD